MSEIEHQGRYLKEVGTVAKVEGDYVYVLTQRSTGCSGCSSESGCGTSALSKLFSRESRSPIKVNRTVDCEVGDSVELLLDESRLLKHSFMAYGLPLIGMFLVAITVAEIAESGYQLSASIVELLTIFGAVLGLFFGWKITQTFYKPVLPDLGKVLTKKP